MTQATLYIVSTPIGNLDDITLRALHVLKQVDVIAAEDTRHSKKLLQHFSINTALISLHEYNEREQSEKIIALLRQGKNIALISDAGTPLISDPGYVLVKKVREENFKVMPIPGACAAIVALSAAGLPTDKFIFEGFLSAKSQARKEQLQQLMHETRTIIFYEAPHRMLATINDMIEIFSDDREAVIARELTKTFETIVNGSLNELKKYLESDENHLRGEFVILLHGAEVEVNDQMNANAEKVLKILLAELPVSQAVSLAAEITGAKRNWLYQLAIKK